MCGRLYGPGMAQIFMSKMPCARRPSRGSDKICINLEFEKLSRLMEMMTRTAHT